MKYVIWWKSLITGTTRHGKTSFPKKDAQNLVDRLNKKYKNELVHWIEPEVREKGKEE